MNSILEEIDLFDLYVYGEQIKRRKFADYIIEARISAYPHMEKNDQEEFMKSLFKGAEYEVSADEIDTNQSIALLKGAMSKSKGFAVK